MKQVLSWVFGISSLLLLYSLPYYIYALNKGINIDPTLIPHGNEYFRHIEEAIKSNDSSKKLDALLEAQLKDFWNAEDVIALHKKLILFSMVPLLIAFLILIIRKAMLHLYPLSFFAFGYQQKNLEKLHRKREVWNIAIILGFIINLLAGIVLTFLI